MHEEERHDESNMKCAIECIHKATVIQLFSIDDIGSLSSQGDEKQRTHLSGLSVHLMTMDAKSQYVKIFPVLF